MVWASGDAILGYSWGIFLWQRQTWRRLGLEEVRRPERLGRRRKPPCLVVAARVLFVGKWSPGVPGKSGGLIASCYC